MFRSPSFRFDCRLTGVFYLCLAITGAFGFMTVRPQLFVWSGKHNSDIACSAGSSFVARSDTC